LDQLRKEKLNELLKKHEEASDRLQSLASFVFGSSEVLYVSSEQLNVVGRKFGYYNCL